MVNSGSAWESMQRETRWRYGDVPRSIGNFSPTPGHFTICDGSFLLIETGFACHYRVGQGITVRLDDPSREGELKLALEGTVHAAVAALCGLFPLHASAIATSRGVIAFTGDSGAGKSTLAAALNRRGFQLFNDDTLILDPSGSVPLCMPGHKRLKLWPEGAELAGAERLELVSEDYRKYFATSEGTEASRPLPLAALLMLEQGPDCAVEPVTGARRLELWNDDHYTRGIHLRAQGQGQSAQMALVAKMAAAVPAWRFTRPFEPARFQESVDFMAGWIENWAQT